MIPKEQYINSITIKFLAKYTLNCFVRNLIDTCKTFRFSKNGKDFLNENYTLRISKSNVDKMLFMKGIRYGLIPKEYKDQLNSRNIDFVRSEYYFENVERYYTYNSDVIYKLSKYNKIKYLKTDIYNPKYALNFLVHLEVEMFEGTKTFTMPNLKILKCNVLSHSKEFYMPNLEDLEVNHVAFNFNKFLKHIPKIKYIKAFFMKGNIVFDNFHLPNLHTLHAPFCKIMFSNVPKHIRNLSMKKIHIDDGTFENISILRCRNLICDDLYIHPNMHTFSCGICNEGPMITFKTLANLNTFSYKLPCKIISLGNVQRLYLAKGTIIDNYETLENINTIEFHKFQDRWKRNIPNEMSALEFLKCKS